MTTQRPTIFSQRLRDDDSPSSNEESTFEFLDRAKGERWAQARATVESWASHVPEHEYARVRGDLRADDHSFKAAFFELWIHESLRRNGYQIEVHPRLPASSRRPDFLATRGDHSFYVEAMTPGPQPKALAESRRRARFVDAINRLDAGSWWLSLNHLTVGEHAVSASALRSDLRAWLATLSVADVRPERAVFEWRRDDWVAEFGALKRSVGGNDTRAIGMYADSPARFIDDAGDIRSPLERKASEYRGLDKPFIVAAAVYVFDRDDEDVEAALFGDRRVTGNGATERDGGFFGSRQHPARTAVAGALVVNQLMPYHLDYAHSTFARHPWVATSLPTPPPFPAREATLADGEVKFVEPAEVATKFFEVPD